MHYLAGLVIRVELRTSVPNKAGLCIPGIQGHSYSHWGQIVRSHWIVQETWEHKGVEPQQEVWQHYKE
jgi:hypothetical protein